MRSILSVLLCLAFVSTQALAAPASTDGVDLSAFAKLAEDVHQASSHEQAVDVVEDNIQDVRSLNHYYKDNPAQIVKDLRNQGWISRKAAETLENRVKDQEGLFVESSQLTDRELAELVAIQAQNMGGYGNGYGTIDTAVTIVPIAFFVLLAALLL